LRTNKLLGIIFASLLLTLVMTTLVSSIGLAPASKEVLLTKNNFEYELKIFNQEKEEGTFDITATGDLAQFVSFSEDTVTFDRKDEYKLVKVIFNMPNNFELSGGDYITRVLVQKQTEKIQHIGALLGVASILKITVPYEGIAIEVKLIAPTFNKGTINNFAIEAENKGNQNAQNCKADIEIFNHLDTKIATLTSEQRIISSKTKEIFLLPWSADEENGNYKAKAKFVCENVEIFKEAKFTIGGPEITIENLSVDKFTLGEIVKFDLLLASNWGEPIQGVFVDVELLKDEVQIASAKTESVEIEAFGKLNVPFYIDTDGLEPGEYIINITVNYLGRQISEGYIAYVTPDSVVFNAISGKVVAGDELVEKGTSTFKILLIIVCMLVIIFNVVRIVMHHKKK